MLTLIVEHALNSLLASVAEEAYLDRQPGGTKETQDCDGKGR